MATRLKKVAIALIAFAVIGVVGFVGLIAVVVVGDSKAKEKATALCAPALVGLPKGDALERARKAEAGNRELRWHEGEAASEELLVVFPAALPLTGYMCTISARDGVV